MDTLIDQDDPPIKFEVDLSKKTRSIEKNKIILKNKNCRKPQCLTPASPPAHPLHHRHPESKSQISPRKKQVKNSVLGVYFAAYQQKKNQLQILDLKFVKFYIFLNFEP